MKLLKKLSNILCLALGVSIFATSSALAQRPSRTQNVVERLAELEQYSTLVTAVGAAELGETLAGLDQVTIFAPTNDAFAKIPEDTLTALLADKEALTNLLTYHAVGDRLSTFRLRNGALETLQGGNVEISRTHYRSWWWSWYSRIKVNDSNVVEPNIRATNGIIHGIDTVLDPAFMAPQSILDIAKGNNDFSTLASLVEQAGLARALDSDRLELTVFAPTNAAFEALPAETLEAVQNDRRLLRFILKNHIVRGAVKSTDLSTGTVRTTARTELDIVVSDPDITVGGANVGPADIMASNGVVHVIDKVLIPEELDTLLGVVESRDDLSTFKAALDAAGYSRFFDLASRYWQFTLFAPNNEAFSAIPTDALNALLEDKHALRSVLNRHIAFRKVLSSDLADGQSIRTIGGVRLNVAISEGGDVTLNGAPVVDVDLKASNGVVHIIGEVLPESTPGDGGDNGNPESER